MADESIGGVTVSIRGDASQLNQDFAAAQQQAQQAGEKIAAAFAVPVSAVNDLGAASKAAGVTISEALASPIPATVSLSEALANVKAATADLASAQLQLGQFAANGNQAAIATIAEYQAALDGAQASVLAAKEAQAGLAVAAAEAAAGISAAAGESTAAASSQGAQLAVLQGQYREVSGAIRQSVTLIAQTEAAAGAEIRQGHAATAVSLQATANAERATLDGLIQAQVRLAASMAEVKYAAVSVDASVLDLTAGMQGLAIVEALAAQGAIDEAAALAEDATAAAGAALAVESFAAAHSHVVPEVAAASGAIRVFEGNLPIRAVERFAVTTLGLGPILSAAFPIVGAIAFGEMIYKVFSELDPLIAAEKELAEVTKRLDHEYAQLSKEIEHIQIEDLTVKFGKARGESIAAFYSNAHLADDQARIKTLEADIAYARARMASDAATAQTKSNPLVSTLEAFNPLITGERFAANRDYQAQQKKIQEAEDEIGALRLKGQKDTRQGELDGDREDKDRRDKALSAAKEAAAAAKAIDDAAERNVLASNDRELAAAKEAISARLNLEKIGTEASLALIDDKHTRTILAAANEVAEKVTSEQLLNDKEREGLKTRLAMLDADIAATANHGKAGVAEAIRLEGEKDTANAKYYADVLKRADDVNAALASLGVLEVRENKARLDEELKDWTENANKEIDVAQKAFLKIRNDARLGADAQIKIAEIHEVGGNEREKIALQEAYARSLDHSAQAQLRLGEATLAIDARIVAAEVHRANLKLANDAKAQADSKVITQDQIALASAIDHQSTALAREAAQLDHLRLAANRVHQVFVGLKADFDHAFQSLNHNLASAIVGAKSFHDAWQHTIKSVAESILNTLINAALGALEAAIVKVIVNFLSVGVSTAATNVASVMSYAAVAFAAAFASTAAIPIIGPALAPAAAAAAYAAVAAESPLASFDKGGFVPDDMIAQIHKGEYIVPAAAAQRGIYDPHHGQDGGGDSGNTDAIVRALENNTAALKSIHTSVSTTEAVNATTGAVHEVKQAVESSNRDAITSGNVLHKLLPQTSTDVADSIKKIFSGGLLGSFFGGSSTSAEDANALAVRVVNFPKDSKGGIGGIFGGLFGGLLGFAEGGWVQADQIAQVHKGEYVLTAEQAKGLQASGTQLPSLPSVHGSNMPQLPNVSSSSSNSSIGEVKITVNGAQRPQETAREIAKYLKSLSPKFSPAS